MRNMIFLQVFCLLSSIISIKLVESVNEIVGELDYSLEVTNGDATVKVNIPILTKGNANLLPTIELMYSSSMSTENDELGVGWALRGKSVITRCARYPDDVTKYTRCKTSNPFEKVTYDYGDTFCLDGQRLMLQTGSYGRDQSEYKTRLESYKKVVAYGNQGRGPKYFKVFTKENLIYTYGLDESATLSIGTHVTIGSWYLSKIENYAGNEITYSYMKVQKYCYLSVIKYGNKKIVFNYQNRTDVQRKYFDGQLESYVDRIMNRIDILNNEVQIRRLEFEYVKYGPVSMNLLKKIKLCYYSNNECTRPLIFDYDNENKIIESFQDHITFKFRCGTNKCDSVQMVDMNGDGKTDIVGFSSSGIYVALSYGNFFGSSMRWTTEFGSGWDPSRHVRYLSDVNKDGLPDMVGFGERSVNVALNVGMKFADQNIWSYEFCANVICGGWLHPRYLIDMNNDGYPDIFSNTKMGTVVSYNDGKSFRQSNLYSSNFGLDSKWSLENPFYIADVNADGYIDLFGFGPNSTFYSIDNKLFETSYVNHHLGQNTGWKMNDFRHFVDINRDSLPDLLAIKQNGDVIVGLAEPQGDSRFTYKNQIWAKYDLKVAGRTQTYADLNGDDYIDLAFFDCTGLYVMLNDGKSFQSRRLWSNTINKCDIAGDRLSQYLVDINGDGLSDVVEILDDQVRLALNLNRKPRLTRIFDSLKNEKLVTYSPLPEALIPGSLITTERSENAKRSELVVNSLSVGIWGAPKNTIFYRYKSFACSDKYDKSSCSFEGIKQQSAYSKIYTIDSYYIDYPLTGQLKTKHIYHDQQLLKSEAFIFKVHVSNTRSDADPEFNQFSYVQTKKETTYYDFLSGKYLKSEIGEYQHDQYGNVISYIETITNRQSRLSKIYTNQVEANEQNWNLCMIKKKSTRYEYVSEKGQKEAKEWEERFDFDPNTRLLTKKIEINEGTAQLEEIYEYDKFNNMISVSRKDLKTGETRSKWFEYDANGANVIRARNELGHDTTFKYDVRDNLIEMNDANNVRSTYEYNNFGKIVLETNNGYSNTSWSFEWDDSLPTAVYSVTKSVSNGPSKQIIYDGINNELRSISKGFNSEVFYEDSVYDKSGQLIRKSYPYRPGRENVSYIQYEYDNLQRLIKLSENLGFKKETTFTYKDFDVITKDNIGNIKIESKEYLDQVITVQDKTDTRSHYTYDLYGNLASITDPQGVKTELVYNKFGKIIQQRDPYQGEWQNTYNAFNELVSTKYVNGSTILYSYDLLGRIVERVEPEGTTSWIYDTAPNGIGQLARIISPSIVREYAYDSVGRETQITFTYSDSINYSIKTNYDPMGRISSQIYAPSMYTLYRCYDSMGFMMAVSRNDQNCKDYVWKANVYDVYSNIKSEMTSNGVQTDYEYNDYDQITNIRLKRFDQVLADLTYKYDNRNNLVEKLDVQPDGRKLTDKYEYDSLDRLIDSKLYEVLSEKNGAEKLIENRKYQYDMMGNIRYANDVRNQNYQYNNARKPQQATRIGEEFLEYDSFGRVYQTSSYEITWSSFSKPKQIRTNTPTRIEFEYGPDRERVSKKVNDTLTIHYLGDAFERWIIRDDESKTDRIIDKFYVYVGNKLVAQEIWDYSNPAELYFVNEDAFGNIDSIFDHEGNMMVKYKYSLYGHRSTVFSNVSANTSLLFNLGFLCNDNIDGRLILFQGRVFDAIFARFLSPDPFIQEPFNIQNLNRYTYGTNNPFKFKDSSGYRWKKFFKKVAAVTKALVTNPKFLAAIALTIVTAGALAPYAAAIAATISTNVIVAAAISKAIVVAATTFVSAMVMTDGNLKESLNQVKDVVTNLAKGSIKDIAKEIVKGVISNYVPTQLIETYENIKSGIDKIKETIDLIKNFNVKEFLISTAMAKVDGFITEQGMKIIDKGQLAPMISELSTKINDIPKEWIVKIPDKDLFTKNIREGIGFGKYLVSSGIQNQFSGMKDTFYMNEFLMSYSARDVLKA